VSNQKYSKHRLAVGKRGESLVENLALKGGNVEPGAEKSEGTAPSEGSEDYERDIALSVGRAYQDISAVSEKWRGGPLRRTQQFPRGAP